MPCEMVQIIGQKTQVMLANARYIFPLCILIAAENIAV